MYTVYMHQNKINGKRYIGITKQKPEVRWGIDGIKYKSSPHFYSAIQKYGWDNFYHYILFTDLSKESACRKEKDLIKAFHTQDNRFGYNVLEGGDMPSMPPEIRAKLSKSLKGNKNGKGHPCSPEKREKISKAQKGKKLTTEHKQKLSEAAKKRHTPCSEEKKGILSKSYPHQKSVYCSETDTVYRSVQYCAKQLGLHAPTVSKVCKGKLHATGGYHLKYYNEELNA